MSQREIERERERERERRTKEVDRATIHNKHSNIIQISMRAKLRICRRVGKFEKKETRLEMGNASYEI
jgi:hypothetical protein